MLRTILRFCGLRAPFELSKSQLGVESSRLEPFVHGVVNVGCKTWRSSSSVQATENAVVIATPTVAVGPNLSKAHLETSVDLKAKVRECEKAEERSTAGIMTFLDGVF